MEKSKEVVENQKNNLSSYERLKKILNENKEKRVLIVPADFLVDITKKIDKMENNAENYISGKQIDIWAKQVNERRNKNRAAIEKILFNLPNLQRAVSDNGDLNDFEKYSIGISEKISENDDFVVLQDNENSKEETRKLLKKYKNILDDYLETPNDKKNTYFMNVKLSNIESKKAILRKWYGYGLRDKIYERDELNNIVKDENGKPIYKIKKDKMGKPLKDEDGNLIYEKEKKVNSFLDLCYELSIDQRTLYNYKKELLDELAPAFFGIDGIYLDV